MRKLMIVALAALGMLTSMLNAASDLTFTRGDLLMGFHTTGVGSAQDYVVNLGQGSLYTGASSSFVVANLGNIKADLDAVFGVDASNNGWGARADVYWGIYGTSGTSTNGTDPALTLYASKQRASAGTALLGSERWQRNASQGAPTLKMNGSSIAYAKDPVTSLPNKSTNNSSVGRIQNTQDSNCYVSYQPGSGSTNAGAPPGISFAYFNPSIEGTFGSGTAGSVLELHRMAPGAGAGDIVGTFQLDNSGNLTFTPGSVSSTATISLSASTASVSETVGTGYITVTINRTVDTTGAVTVSLNTGGGSAAAGTDYTAVSTQVSFLAGEAQKTVDIPIANIAGVQGDRTFLVSLTTPTGGAQLGATATQTVTILEGQSAVAFQSGTYSVIENQSALTVTVVRTGNLSGSSSVTLATADGTALGGTDFTAVAGTQLTFNATQTSQTLDIPILNRAGSQGNRTFTVDLSAPSVDTAIISPNSSTVTITDYTPVVTPVPGSLAFSASSYQGNEGSGGDTTLTVTVNRTGGSDGAVGITVSALAGGTATATADYTGLPVTLNWADGDSAPKTFAITIKSDAVSESPETVLLSLGTSTGGVGIGAQGTATATILNVDLDAPQLVVLSPRANATVTSASVNVRGTVSDAQGVSKVEVLLNGGVAQSATLAVPDASGTIPWSLSVTPEQGTNVVLVKAYDLQNNISQDTRSVTFHNLRPLLAGTYNGLILADADNGVQLNHNGLITVTVGSTGLFTGKATLAGGVLPIKGVFLNDGTAAFGVAKTSSFELVKKATPANISLGFLTLTLDTTNSGHKITGTLTNQAGTTVLATIPKADQALYSKKLSPPAPYVNVPVTLLDPTKEKGKYTAILGAMNAPNNGVPAIRYPQGNGFGSITLSGNGMVKVVGKLADGSPISYSNAISLSNEWPVFIPLYGKRGFVIGNVTFDPNVVDSDATGSMQWFKPSGLAGQKTYADGWANGIALDFAASKFIAPKAATLALPNPPNPDTVLGAGAIGSTDSTTNNLTIVTEGLQANTSNDGNLNKTSKVTILGVSPASVSAADLKVTLAGASGKLTGIFTYGTTTKKVALSGVVFQKTNTASGFFLYLPGTTNPIGQAESGAVGVIHK